RRRDDERREQHHRHDGEMEELLVHAATAWSRFARLEISISPATRKKFDTMLDPPYETNGSVMPVSGITRVMPPTMTKVWKAKPKLSPAASSFEKPSLAASAIRK